jgi:hypothetical protein
MVASSSGNGETHLGKPLFAAPGGSGGAMGRREPLTAAAPPMSERPFELGERVLSASYSPGVFWRNTGETSSPGDLCGEDPENQKTKLSRDRTSPDPGPQPATPPTLKLRSKDAGRSGTARVSGGASGSKCGGCRRTCTPRGAAHPVYLSRIRRRETRGRKGGALGYCPGTARVPLAPPNPSNTRAPMSALRAERRPSNTRAEGHRGSFFRGIFLFSGPQAVSGRWRGQKGPRGGWGGSTEKRSAPCRCHNPKSPSGPPPAAAAPFARSHAAGEEGRRSGARVAPGRQAAKKSAALTRRRATLRKRRRATVGEETGPPSGRCESGRWCV